MNRRGFLGRTIAALVAAVTLAPAVQADAAPDTRDAFDRAWDAIEEVNRTSKTSFTMIDDPTLAGLAALKYEVGHNVHPGWTADMLLREIKEGRLHLLVSETPFSEVVAEARAEGYEQERAIELERARSAAALGLPLERSARMQDAGIYISGDTDATFKHGVMVHPSYDPPTFEAMQADCDARGCRLVKIFEVDRMAFVFHHDTEPWRPVNERRYETHAEDGQRYVDRTPDGLARVDAWRRSLHASQPERG